MAIQDSFRPLNHLLARLPAADWQALKPGLDWVELPQGTMLYAAGAVLKHVYFPVTAVVSLVSSLQNGDTAEVAVVGSEGLVGVWAFLGGATAESGAVVQCAGYGLRARADQIAALAQRSAAFSQQLLAYTQTLITQMTQSSACNRHHSVDQQLCRWLLLVLDRQAHSDVRVTHERIAGLLGVRREGITGAARKLREAGLVEYGRGRLTVLDREGLEARSCECYGVVRRAFDRLRASSPALAAPASVSPASVSPAPLAPALWQCSARGADASQRLARAVSHAAA
jgi:CRP-like cAMP-binding protein